MSLYYVYALVDPRTDSPFYIGMGKNKRAESHLKNSPYKQRSNPHRYRKIRQIQEAGLQPIIRIIVSGLNSKAEAGEIEKSLIIQYGRSSNGTGILTNIRPGGICGRHVNGDDYTSNTPVDQYSLLGEYLQTFPSAAEAARHVSAISSTSIGILSCCHKSGNNKSCKGYLWSVHGVPLDTDWCWAKKKPVYQWTLTGVFIQQHTTSSTASRITGISRSAIGDCLNGKIPRAGDFMWTYTSDPPPPYSGKRRAVLCVETNEVYKSVGTAAKHFQIDTSGLAAACRKNGGYCKGYTFKYVDN